MFFYRECAINRTDKNYPFLAKLKYLNRYSPAARTTFLNTMENYIDDTNEILSTVGISGSSIAVYVTDVVYITDLVNNSLVYILRRTYSKHTKLPPSWTRRKFKREQNTRQQQVKRI